MRSLYSWSGLLLAVVLTATSCGPTKDSSDKDTAGTVSATSAPADYPASIANYQAQTGTDVDLPEPFATKSARNSPNVVGWSAGQTPTAPKGFTVTAYKTGLNYPRWIHVLPNGDITVAESKKDQIVLLRDTDKDGLPDERHVLLDGLNRPLGMLFLEGKFYVANTDGVVRYAYVPGTNKITSEGEKIMDLPAGGYNRHWTRNIVANADGSKIYVSVGSATNRDKENIDRQDARRCAVLEANPDGTERRIFASGMRNPVGMAWNPITKELWAAVNERDEIGDNLPPDYLASLSAGDFYGYPWLYWGKRVDPHYTEQVPQELSDRYVNPDYALGSHTASLGLAFCSNKNFPKKYQNGAFVGQHGSWNRSKISGYQVLFVPFDATGKPLEEPEAFLTGFIDTDKRVFGRPVYVGFHPDGYLLVTDDASNTIWKVEPS